MNERRKEQRRLSELGLIDARSGRRRHDGKAGWLAFGVLAAAIIVVGFVVVYLSSLVMM